MERGVQKEEVVIVHACQRASAMFLPLNPKFILISFTARPLATFDGSSQKQTTICPLLLDLHVSNSSSCLPVSSRCVNPFGPPADHRSLLSHCLLISRSKRVLVSRTLILSRAESGH